MRKLLAVALIFSFLLTFAVPALAGNQASITFSFWDKNQEPGMKAIADAYMEKNPNVKVEVQVTPWNEYWTKLEAAAMGGAMPDVFWMHSNQFFKYADAGILMDLSPLNLDYSPYPSGITALYNYNGQQLAVPKDYDTIALVYNKEIFDKAGVAYPDDTWNWDKLVEVAKQLHDPDNNVYGFGASQTTQGGFYNTVYQNGGFIFENGVSGYNLPETKEGVKRWVDFVLTDKVSPGLSSFVDMGVDDQFMSGRLAMTFAGSWVMSSYTSNELIKDKFDLAVLPMGKVRASIYNGLGYAGAANSKYPEVVADFIAFAGSEEANILQAKAKAAIPAYAGTEKYFIENFPNLNIGCYPEMIEYGVQFAFSPNKSLWEGSETELITSIYTGERTVEEACDQLHEIITRIEAEGM